MGYSKDEMLRDLRTDVARLTVDNQTLRKEIRDLRHVEAQLARVREWCEDKKRDPLWQWNGGWDFADEVLAVLTRERVEVCDRAEKSKSDKALLVAFLDEYLWGHVNDDVDNATLAEGFLAFREPLT